MMFFVLGILALSTTDNGGMRPILLLLLITAVILLLIGCSIALLTLRNQRKDYLAFITVEKPDSARETY
jgi:ABC-type branched-subunit amino acid transport system permease subunit